jgi:hypothetical protein
MFGFEVPWEVLEEMIRNLPVSHAYTDSRGLPSAREAVERHYPDRGLPDVDVDDVFLGNRVSEWGSGGHPAHAARRFSGGPEPAGAAMVEFLPSELTPQTRRTQESRTQESRTQESLTPRTRRTQGSRTQEMSAT